ncbi:hypothetical protein [Bradyrhizobium septentrionale]|uniref:Uncharacterized protein n=1 Tax=Bradyrhizobium septentrionale TaxID=1404411 RepID=A0ABZ2P4N5_9BRAD
MFRSIVTGLTVLAAVQGAAAADSGCGAASVDFGCYMAKAAHRVVKERGNLGWSGQAYMTRDFNYGSSKIKANPDKSSFPTRRPGDERISCNGAVLEIWFKAIELYQADYPDWRPDEVIPAKHWNSESLKYPRAHIDMYEILEMPPVETLLKAKQDGNLDPELRNELLAYDVKSVAHGLQRFGLAEVIPISNLKAGDVITFDRKTYDVYRGRMTSKENFHSTHSAIFISWLDENQQEISQYSGAKGFKYVSSQTNDGGSGLGYRWAYFSGFCPQDPSNVVRERDERYCPDQRKQDTGNYTSAFPKQKSGQKSDCCIIHSNAAGHTRGIVVGRIKAPNHWTEYETKQKLNEEKFNALVERVKAALSERVASNR